MGLIILTALFIFLGMWYINTHNHFKLLQKQITNARQRITNQTSKRNLSLSELIDISKVLEGTDQKAIEEVSTAYRTVKECNQVTKSGQAEKKLAQSLAELYTKMADHAIWTEDEKIRKLLDKLSFVEANLDEIQKAHNKLVMKYNSNIQNFPTSLVGEFCDLKLEEYCERVEQRSCNKKGCCC